MMRLCVFALALAALAQSPAIHAASNPLVPNMNDPVQIARNQKNSGHYPQAIAALKDLVAQGNSAAEIELGLMYVQGVGVTPDYDAGMDLIAQAASQGDADAAQSAGVATYFHLLQRMAEKGDGDAQNALGVIYFSLAPQLPIAMVVARPGEPPPTGNPYDRCATYELPLKWFQMAADQGNSEAKKNLGMVYLKCRQSPDNYFEALSYYTEGADKENASAQFLLGGLYEAGRGVPQDDEKAANWYRKSADQGNYFAENAYFSLLTKGKLSSQSADVTAKIIAKKTSDAAIVMSGLKERFPLVIAHMEGGSLPGDAPAWRELAKRLDKSKDVETEVLLGVMIAKGIGTIPSGNFASRWFEKAAAQGSIEALYDLGAVRANGTTFPSQLLLAGFNSILLWSDGAIIGPDDQAATKWFKEAAAKGNSAAEAALKVLAGGEKSN